MNGLWKHDLKLSRRCIHDNDEANSHEMNQIMAVDKAGNVLLDLESLAQPPDRCCPGSPTLMRILSRKGSNLNRTDRRTNEDQEIDDAPKKLVVKVVPSQLDQLKQPLVTNKPLVSPQSAANSPIPTDSGEARNKRFNRLATVHPRKILLFFASMSSMGSMILIYFTLAIYRRG